MALVDAAANTGADAVKFQLYRWEDIVTVPGAQDPRFELPPDWVPELAERAHSLGMDFLCTPFAPWAVEALRPYVGAWKIASFEALRPDLFLATDDKVRIISIGMITEEERMDLMALCPYDIFLHCVSSYPVRLKSSGLWRMKRLARRHHRIGISDHTTGWESVVSAVTMGARTIEKHIRLKNQPPSPDNGPWALRPARFKKMVKAIRAVQASMDLPYPSRPTKLPEYEGRKVHWGRKGG